jgi:hypothetical protein
MDRALNNGLIQITDDPISIGVNAGIALTKAALLPVHNIACIGNKKDKMAEFEEAQAALDQLAAIQSAKAVKKADVKPVTFKEAKPAKCQTAAPASASAKVCPATVNPTPAKAETKAVCQDSKNAKAASSVAYGKTESTPAPPAVAPKVNPTVSAPKGQSDPAAPAARMPQTVTAKTSAEEQAAEARYERAAAKLVELNRENLVELKRVENPVGGGHSWAPTVESSYRFFINENRFLDVPMGEKTRGAVGFAAKSEGYDYGASSGYKGGGDYRGYGISAEVSHAGEKGGFNATGSFGFGNGHDKGRAHYQKKNAAFYSGCFEYWRNDPKLKTKNGWSFLDGIIVSADGKTGDYNHVSVEPVIMRSPHDVLKVTAGFHLLNLNKPGNTFGGAGAMVQVMDGIGVRFTKYAGGRSFVTGWVDPYRVYWKYRQLEAERITEISWDKGADLGSIVPISASAAATRGK